MEPQLTKVPYGLWSSPLIPQGLGSQLRLVNPQFDSDGRSLLWLEGRSGKGGLVFAEKDGRLYRRRLGF